MPVSVLFWVLMVLLCSCDDRTPSLEFTEGEIVAKGNAGIALATPSIPRGEVYPIDKRTRFYIDGREVRIAEIPSRGVRAVMVWKPGLEWWLVEVRVKTQ